MIFFYFFFEKKIRSFFEGEVAEIRDVTLTVISPQISTRGLTLAAVLL